MKVSKIKIFVVSLFFIIFFSSVNFCYALSLKDAFRTGDGTPLSGAVERGAGFSTDVSFTDIVSGVITSVLSLMGVIFLVLMIYAGFKWMTARGEEEKVTEAKETLTRAIIGLVIVLSAYAISYFVVSSISYKVLQDKPNESNTNTSDTTPVPVYET